MSEDYLDLRDKIKKEIVLSAEEEIKLLRKERNILREELNLYSAINNAVKSTINNTIKIVLKNHRKKLVKQISQLNPKEYANFLREHNADKEFIDGAKEGFEECKRVILKYFLRGERK